MASDDALTLEEKGDALSTLLLDEYAGDGVMLVNSTHTVVAEPESSEIGLLAIPPFTWPGPVPAGKVSLRHVGRDFESHVRRAFVADGWTVRPVPRYAFADFVVEKDLNSRIVEVKAVRHLSLADVAQIMARLAAESAEFPGQLILVVPAGSLSAAAARLIDEIEHVSVLWVPIVPQKQSS